jgi:hypothetical protein
LKGGSRWMKPMLKIVTTLPVVLPPEAVYWYYK